MIGRTIAHYLIVESLGEGGMGVVYRAEDQRLHRTVALKMLSPHLLAGDEERRRFLREAQAAAALNHPNITTIHATEEEDGQAFIVMEYVEGSSLEQIISRGPLKLAETLDIAIQLCDGLRSAHAKEIIHRDVKSANVMVTPEGHVKILDFGLARLRNASRLTHEGMTIGTLAYMSPEQVRGDPLDRRTDIWSVGVVLYQMVAGSLPFKGEFDQALAYQIQNESPEPLTAVRTGVPPELERIVAKALSGDPRDRYQHLDDLLVDLHALRRTLSTPASSGTPPLRRQSSSGSPRWQHVLPWGVAALAATVAALALLNSGPGQPRADRVIRFTMHLDSGQTLNVWDNLSIAISRDGGTVAYIPSDSDRSYLCVRNLSGLTSTRLPGTEDARFPFFSYDGSWIAFSSRGKLRKISLRGGRPFEICDVASLAGGDWGMDDTITYADQRNGSLWRVFSGGGSPRQITYRDRDYENETALVYPQMLPGGNTILFTGRSYGGTGQIGLFSLETDTRTTLLSGGYMARYIPTGHIVYSRPSDGTLFVVRFDIDTRSIQGQPVPVLAGIRSGGVPAQYVVSDDGTLLYVPAEPVDPRTRIVRVDLQGRETLLPVPRNVHISPRVSPDGSSLLYTVVTDGRSDIWILDRNQGTSRRFTDATGNEFWAVWHPDGRRIVYNRAPYDGVSALWMIIRRTDSPDSGRVLPATEWLPQPCAISPDGQWLVFQEGISDQTKLDILEMSLEGEQTILPLLRTPSVEHLPALSPDGRWFAYVSDETGSSEVYVRPFHMAGAPVRVSSQGGTEPVWAPGGSALYFRDVSGRKLYATSVRSGDGLHFDGERLLFEGNYEKGYIWGRSYDIDRDGKHFIMLKSDEPPKSSRFIVVDNWIKEVRQKAGATE